ncbi:MAG: glycosyltransferase [Bacteroidetes bacterium]|nr:glycosyltransferase [Bacteroidota bacterium]
MKRIKLLHFISGIDIGGAEQLLLSSLRKIDLHLFDVSICYLKGNGTLRKEFESAGIKVIALPDYSHFLLFRIIKFQKILFAEHFDILHNHLINAILIGRITGKIAGIKICVSTEHNTSNWQKKYFFIHWLYRLTHFIDNKIFAISQAVQGCLVSIGKIPKNKIEVLYDGVDLNRFKLNDSNKQLKKILIIEEDIPIIGCISRLDIRKGHIYLLKAVKQLVNEFPTIKLVLVGDGNYREELEKEAKNSGINNSVIFTGTQKDINSYLAIFDIFVLPSLHEGLSIAIIEAMAMEKAIIATNVGGIPELIKNEFNGILVEPRKPEELYKAMKYLLLQPSKRLRFGKNSRKKAEECFNLDKIIKTLEKRYCELLSE